MRTLCTAIATVVAVRLAFPQTLGGCPDILKSVVAIPRRLTLAETVVTADRALAELHSIHRLALDPNVEFDGLALDPWVSPGSGTSPPDPNNPLYTHVSKGAQSPSTYRPNFTSYVAFLDDGHSRSSFDELLKKECEVYRVMSYAGASVAGFSMIVGFLAAKSGNTGQGAQNARNLSDVGLGIGAVSVAVFGVGKIKWFSCSRRVVSQFRRNHLTLVHKVEHLTRELNNIKDNATRLMANGVDPTSFPGDEALTLFRNEPVTSEEH